MRSFNLSDRDKEIDDIHKEFNEIVEEELEGFKVTRTSSQSSPFLGGPASFQARFYNKNAHLKGTKYHLENNFELVHFTSFQVLNSILSHRVIRLYNLMNSNDPTEYEWASSVLGIDVANKDFIKKNTFTFSTCSSDELENDYMWANYADKEYGVALKFSIANDIDLWENFYFSNIRYGELDHISSLGKRLYQLNEKYPKCDFDIELHHLLAFHKENIDRWAYEREIRILGIAPFSGNERHCNVFQDFKKNYDGNGDRITEYIQLPIWINSDLLSRFYRHTA